MKRDIVERFFSHVEKTATCWLWTGGRSRGYGQFMVGSKADGTKRMLGAHRWAYEYCNGAIPSGLDVDHLCRNRACVNPEHLEAVTRRENILRGEGIAAERARQTHCAHGHEFTPENTVRWYDGCRQCRTCNREEMARRRARRKKLLHA